MRTFAHISFLFLLVILTNSCQEIQDPQFIRMDKVEIKSMGMDLVELHTIGEFYNPNPASIKVLDWNIELIANEVNVGNVELKLPAEIPAKNNFALPMIIRFPPSQLVSKKSGLIGGILSTVLDKKVELEYKGYVLMEILNIQIRVPIEEFKELELKL